MYVPSSSSNRFPASTLTCPSSAAGFRSSRTTSRRRRLEGRGNAILSRLHPAHTPLPVVLITLVVATPFVSPLLLTQLTSHGVVPVPAWEASVPTLALSSPLDAALLLLSCFTLRCLPATVSPQRNPDHRVSSKFGSLPASLGGTVEGGLDPQSASAAVCVSGSGTLQSPGRSSASGATRAGRWVGGTARGADEKTMGWLCPSVGWSALLCCASIRAIHSTTN
jgi:hypothetical protein